MSTEKIWQMHSTSSVDTETLGEKIGARLRGGEVIELVSDLGGGKTTFVRGLVKGAGSADTVASPTFTINREYNAPTFTIVHFDLYRLAEAGIIADELREFTDDPKVVVVVEWGDVVQNVLPKERLTVDIRQAGGDARDIMCNYPESHVYLIGEKQ